MSKAIKLEDNNYLDSSSIVHNRISLNNVLGRVLWTNPNTDNDFNSQTITLNSSDYDLLEVFFYDYKSRKNMTSSRFIKGKNGFLHCNWSGSGNVTMMRWIEYVSDTKIKIESARISGSVNNAAIIPICVVGYKLGIF